MTNKALLGSLCVLGVVAFIFVKPAPLPEEAAAPANRPPPAMPEPPKPIPPEPYHGKIIDRLPSSVDFQKFGQDRFFYQISGIYNPMMRNEIADGMAPVYRNMIPAGDKFEMDYSKGTCTIMTSRELAFHELAFALDEIAQLGGELPTFTELEARDIPMSSLATRYPYEIVPEKAPGADGFDWQRMPEDGSVLKVPFSYGANDQGSLFIVPATAHCMVHSRFVIRILDREGWILWQDTETGYGTIEIALTDVDQDGAQELHLFRNNHGVEDDFTIRPVKK